MAHPLLEDAFVASLLDEALAPFAAGLGDAQLAWARERLAVMLHEKPLAREALDAAHPRQIDSSGERRRLGLEDDDAGEATS